MVSQTYCLCWTLTADQAMRQHLIVQKRLKRELWRLWQ